MIAATYLLLALLALLGSDLARAAWAAVSLLLVQRELGGLLFRPLPGAAGFVHAATAGAWLLVVLLWCASVAGVLPVVAWLVLGATPLLALRLAAIPVRAAWNVLVRRRWWALGIFVVAAPLLPQMLVPNSDWDGEVYHLPLARQFLESGPLATDPMVLHHAFAGGVSLLYALLLELGGGNAVIPFSAAHGVLLLLATWVVARDQYGSRVAAVAVAVTASSWVVARVALTPRVDHFLALWCIVAVDAVLRCWRENAPHRWLPLAGMALGLAAATKYTGLLWWGLLGPALLFLGARRPRALAVAAACALLPALPWYVRNQVAFGSALYPLHGRLYVDREGSLAPFEPAMRALFQGAGGVPEPYAHLLAENHAPQHMLNPFQLVRHGNRYDQPLHWVSPLLLLLPLFPLLRRDRTSLALAALALLAWLALACAYPTTRLLLPVLPLASIGVAAALARGRKGAALALVLGLGAIAIPWRHEWGMLARQQPWRWWSGSEDEKAFVARVGYSGARTQPLLVAELGRAVARGELAAGDAILMVGEDKRGFVPCRAIVDTSRDGYPWLALLVRHQDDDAAIRAELAARGVRAVFVNTSLIHHNLVTLPWDARDPLRQKEWLLFSLQRLTRFGENHVRRRQPTGEGGVLLWL